LPTEAEWEYAARAGTTRRYSHGDDPAGLEALAWYADNAEQQLHPVATRGANAWGLYDLPGLVWEWCEDWWQPYGPGPMVDPVATTPGNARVVRGGAYTSTARDLRVAARNGYPPATSSRRVGFRVVRSA
jgi:formylglycine-generating enzyme required for sulfatase activity